MPTPEVDVEALDGLLASGAQLVDVRQPEEYAAGRVLASRNIPLENVPERLEEIPAGTTVYVVCARGGRSRAAVAYLRQQGFEAVNVRGGTTGWAESGRPLHSGDRS